MAKERKGVERTKVKGYGTAPAKRAYADYIEYNCMNTECEFMWDQSKDQEPTELCPRCGSNDLHSAPRPPQLRYNEGEYEGVYHGADIYDQYGRY